MNEVTTNIPETVQRYTDEHQYPLVFAALSGAHLYGFPSPDSDFDIRGTHVLPLRSVIGLDVQHQTVDRMQIVDGLEMDIVTHDFLMFCKLLLKKNGNILEQIFSPIVLVTSPEHDELKVIAERCVTKHHIHHYGGFALTKWKEVTKQEKPRVKTLLYLFRVLLTGIHLMKTGVVEANIVRLNDDLNLSYINDLIQTKTEGQEKETLASTNLSFFEREYERLRDELTYAAETSSLPEHPQGTAQLDDLLTRVRLSS